MTLPPCPHCGVVCGVYLKVQVWGWAVSHYDETGGHLEIDYDGIGNGRHGVCRCQACGEIRRDVRMVRSTIVSTKAVPTSE